MLATRHRKFVGAVIDALWRLFAYSYPYSIGKSVLGLTHSAESRKDHDLSAHEAKVFHARWRPAWLCLQADIRPERTAAYD